MYIPVWLSLGSRQNILPYKAGKKTYRIFLAYWKVSWCRLLLINVMSMRLIYMVACNSSLVFSLLYSISLCGYTIIKIILWVCLIFGNLKSLFFTLIFKFWPGHVAYKISVLWLGIEPRPWQWKHQILTTRPPGDTSFISPFYCWWT